MHHYNNRKLFFGIFNIRIGCIYPDGTNAIWGFTLYLNLRPGKGFIVNKTVIRLCTSGRKRKNAGLRLGFTSVEYSHANARRLSALVARNAIRFERSRKPGVPVIPSHPGWLQLQLFG